LSYLDGIALGLFLAAAAFLILFMLIDWKIGEAWIGVAGNMLVAIFSVGAAFLALRGTRIQVQHANDIEEERREDMLAAARAMLPGALSTICGTAKANLRGGFMQGDLFGSKDTEEFPRSLPESVFQILKDCIQYADPITRRRLASLLSTYQIVTSRNPPSQTVKALRTGAIQDHNLISRAIGWALIYALAEHGFEFARGKAKTIPAAMSPDRVRSAFFLAGVPIENYELLEKLLEERIAGNRVEMFT
jgi:hypothetical protein